MDRINIIQIGMCHEHADGKIALLKKRPDVFNLLGFVDERDFCLSPRMPNPYHPEYYSELKRFTLDEALNCPGLEAVTVEVPNNDLVPVAMLCMEHNLAIHMDKPAGEDLTLYKQLLDGCKERKLPFQMGFMFRGNPAFLFCIKAIREKILGDVFEIEADMNHSYGGEPYQQYIGKFPGGLMYNLGCHLIDFVVAAMGRPENVTPFLKSAPGYPDSIHNNCMAVIEYPNALVTLRSCSKESALQNRSLKIAGTKGTIILAPLERFDGQRLELSLSLSEPSGSFPAGRHTLRFPVQRDRYESQLLEFAGMIRGERQDMWTYEHDYLVHEVTLAASNLIKWRA